MTALLEVQGLGISFGGLRAVNDVSFGLGPGEIVSVIGPNGAGKTTLFNMISGIYIPNNLQIFQAMSVLENDIAGYHLRERGPVLADLLALPSSRRRSRAAAEGARALLDRVGLGNAAEKEASALSYGA